MRRGNSGPIDVKIKREPFKLQTVAGRVEGGNIGYLRVAGFDGTTQKALADTVQDLRQRTGNKLIGFILDLRNNPGGNFDAAVATADALIDKGDIVVVKGRKPAATKRISATPGDIAKGLPIVVLINGGTAREAELVVGALQDNQRAVTLGTKSFGESSIESLLPLGNGGAIRLTTARFTTPNGREIQGKGLEPDLGVSTLKLAKLGRGEGRHEADLPGALKNPDQAATPPAKPPADAPPGATATPAPARSALRRDRRYGLDERRATDPGDRRPARAFADRKARRGLSSAVRRPAPVNFNLQTRHIGAASPAASCRRISKK